MRDAEVTPARRGCHSRVSAVTHGCPLGPELFLADSRHCTPLWPRSVFRSVPDLPRPVAGAKGRSTTRPLLLLCHMRPAQGEDQARAALSCPLTPPKGFALGSDRDWPFPPSRGLGELTPAGGRAQAPGRKALEGPPCALPESPALGRKQGPMGQLTVGPRSLTATALCLHASPGRPDEAQAGLGMSGAPGLDLTCTESHHKPLVHWPLNKVLHARGNPEDREGWGASHSSQASACWPPVTSLSPWPHPTSHMHVARGYASLPSWTGSRSLIRLRRTAILSLRGSLPSFFLLEGKLVRTKNNLKLDGRLSSARPRSASRPSECVGGRAQPLCLPRCWGALGRVPRVNRWERGLPLSHSTDDY